MAFTAHEFQVEFKSEGPAQQKWARVSLTLHDTETDTYHVVTATVLTPDRPGEPIRTLIESAADRAAAVLAGAQALLRAHSASELEALQRTGEDKAKAEVGEWE
jgi:hypothetical protein